jgi:hypothetical protein
MAKIVIAHKPKVVSKNAVAESLEGDFNAAGIHSVRVKAYIRVGAREGAAKRVYQLEFPSLSETKTRRLAQLMASNSEFAEVLGRASGTV